MRILLTNDDGVSSIGLTLLAKSLKDSGHRVYIMAPDSDRSGISHAVSFIHTPCKMSKRDEDTWGCSGTPVDCVSLSLMGIFPELRETYPDVVISGINRGANLGTDIIYSGTASAARQASLLGIPAIALSLVAGDDGHEDAGHSNEWHWETAVAFSTLNLEQMLSYWKTDTFVNVNMPNNKEMPLGLAPTFPARRRYTDAIDLYTSPSGDVYSFAKGGTCSSENPAGSDCEAVSKNYASMSAIYIQPVALEDILIRGGGR